MDHTETSRAKPRRGRAIDRGRAQHRGDAIYQNLRLFLAHRAVGILQFRQVEECQLEGSAQIARRVRQLGRRGGETPLVEQVAVRTVAPGRGMHGARE
jgi:hypothetical protein